jgi:endonuclease/exonuclease/phosphatase family metal-dependent hydrolase
MHVVRWVAEAVVWATVAATLAVLATQIVGWTGTRLAAVGQALTPVLGAASVLAAIFGRVWSNWPLTITALVAAAGSAMVVAPALRRRRAAPTTAAPITVLHANLLFENTRHNASLAAAVLTRGADVLALSELHPAHEQTLLDHPAAADYPHRFTESATNADGMAIWSRLPLAEVGWVPMPIRPALLATVCRPDGGALRILLAHPNPPTTVRGLRHWEPSLDECHVLGASPGPPTVLVADLNAARWHPPLRRLLARGWRDAHEAAGRGLSVSWPTTGRWPIPFIRLDHALVDDRLDVLAVDDFTVPGSDHRAFVATIAERHADGAAPSA